MTTAVTISGAYSIASGASMSAAAAHINSKLIGGSGASVFIIPGPANQFHVGVATF